MRKALLDDPVIVMSIVQASCELGDPATAKQYLELVAKRFAGTDEGREARRRLAGAPCEE